MTEHSENRPRRTQGRKGLLVRDCAIDVPTAVERATAELSVRQIHVFAIFDHGRGARSVGLDLPPEAVVVFGDATVGTRLMQVDPTIGLELPLKLLLWEQDGVARVGFADPLTWADRYAIPVDHPVLAGMRHLLDELVEHIAAPA